MASPIDEAAAASRDETWLNPEEADDLGLSLWELAAEPRAIQKGASVTRPLKTIDSELLCPICLGIQHDPVVVQTCLHRFCSECIEKCLRLGRKECPSCRIHVPSRRSLRHDANFNALIQKIHPNLSDYEELEEQLISERNKGLISDAFTESCRQGIENQLRRRKNVPPLSLSKRRTEADSVPHGKRHQTGDNEPLVHCTLRRHPDNDEAVGQLDREFLRTNSDVTMDALQKYVAMKLSLAPSRRVDLLVVKETRTVALAATMSLEEAQEAFLNNGSDLVLLYLCS